MNGNLWPMNKTINDLTTRQKEILRFIYKEIKTNQLPPTLREIASHFDFSSPASVQDHLKALVKKGFVRISDKKSRAIELVKEKLFSVPILGHVQAGAPTLAVENIEGYLNLEEIAFSDNEIFALRVKGDSMINAGIMEGDLVLVRKQSAGEVGKIVVALIGEEATVKYLNKQDGKYFLKPANSRYQPIPLTSEVSILGLVLTVIRDYKNLL